MAPFCESWRRLREQSNAQSPFFTLPPEIRNRIYSSCPILDLLGICRHIRRETLPKFMSTTEFAFDLSAPVKTYLTTMPDWAIDHMRKLSFDAPISHHIFNRADCRMTIIIDRDDKFHQWQSMWEFGTGPIIFLNGKPKEEDYKLPEIFSTMCRILLDSMELEDPKNEVDKDTLLALIKVMELAGRVRGVRDVKGFRL